MRDEKDIENLIRKYIEGEIDRKELDDAVEMFKNPYQNLNLRKILYESWKDEKGLGKQPEPKNLPEELDKIHHQINLEQDIQHTNGARKMIINLLKIAAILIIGVLAGFFVNQFKVQPPVYYTSIAPKGSVSQMILPDNTMVYLNGGSEIKYSINTDNTQREVFLDGEAWFEVAKNTKKSFIVHTPYYDVKVWGTKFNVKAYNNDDKIVTTLEEGSVEVLSSEKLKLKENSFVQPGEQLVYNSQTKIIEIKQVDTRLFTSWKENKLIFINMDLKELIVLLERKFGVDIEVEDNTMLNYHYDGTIKEETILEVLDLLKETLPVRYKIDGQKIIIQNK